MLPDEAGDDYLLKHKGGDQNRVQTSPHVGARRLKLGRKPLHHATIEGRVETMQLLLDAGANVDEKDSVRDSTQ
jgi:ankyrin repeat protein